MHIPFSLLASLLWLSLLMEEPSVRVAWIQVSPVSMLGLIGIGLLIIGLWSFSTSRWLIGRLKRRDRLVSTSRIHALRDRSDLQVRRFLLILSRSDEIFPVVGFVLLTWFTNWIDLVARSFGSMAAWAVDPILLLPFLLTQLAAWLGRTPLIQEWQTRHQPTRASEHDQLFRLRAIWFERARNEWGVLLPILIILQVSLGILETFASQGSQSILLTTIVLATGFSFILLIQPWLFRLCQKTRPLPAGDLRDRLTRLARRCGIRISSILVVHRPGEINAGVVGPTPLLRSVFLTEGLVRKFTPQQIEAVFGHELGHIYHRHIPKLALFILGGFGLLALLYQSLPAMLEQAGRVGRINMSDPGIEVTIRLISGMIVVLVAGAYLRFGFGRLSRALERQADRFGARALACGRTDCPPHGDINSPDAPTICLPKRVCSIAAHQMGSALSQVALHGGVSPDRWFWRHGTIAGRIVTLQNDASHPERTRRHEQGLTWSLRFIFLILIWLNGWLWSTREVTESFFVETCVVSTDQP